MIVWKDINGYEGVYQVSNTGKVRSLAREFVNSLGRLRKVEGAERSFYIAPSGYHLVSLYNDGIGWTAKVHRLVAAAFIPNPQNKSQVNHKDGNKLNNHVDNLEWATPLENTQHAESTGLRNSKGEGNVFFGKKHLKETLRQLSENNYGAVMVLDTETGIFYNTVKSAAMANNRKPVSLLARIKRYKCEKRFVLA